MLLQTEKKIALQPIISLKFHLRALAKRSAVARAIVAGRSVPLLVLLMNLESQSTE